jgi:hypothetical protein
MRLTALGKTLVAFLFLSALGFAGWLETLGY